MDEISETIRKNKEIAEKFHRIEQSLTSFTDTRNLFETLLPRLRDEFAIPFVWISIIRRTEAAQLIQSLESSALLKDHLNMIDEAIFFDLVAGAKPVLANRDLQPFYRLFPKNKKYFIKSIAVVPIALNGRITGSINYGDAVQTRFEPELDTSLIEGLAGSLSACLSKLIPSDPADAGR
jgi:uncharacterized protein YigA (DUF484 family)